MRTSSLITYSAAPCLAEVPAAIEAINVGKKYELQRYRTILLKDAARIAFGGRAEKDVFWALRGVSFTVKKGETVGIIGANGAGKSTLLSLIAKTATPSIGEIKVRGRVSALLELGAGFHPDFTGRENIYINGSVMGLKRRQIDDRMQEIIDFSELGPFIDEPVRNYSSGMMARLGFSVAAAVDPDILIVDEALSVGDQAFQDKSFKRIIEFQERGCTIVFVSHSLDLVQKICQRAFLLSHGQLLAMGSADEITHEYMERVSRHQLEAAVSPYEKEHVPLWKRAIAFAAIAALIGGVAFTGGKYVLSRELPDQRPPPALKALGSGR
jgi:ABC-2 type transport system ATP-binding protein